MDLLSQKDGAAVFAQKRCVPEEVESICQSYHPGPTENMDLRKFAED